MESESELEVEIPEKKRIGEDENVILVGKKPAMTYVLACVTQFSKNSEVKIKARGRAISRAVDVAEITRSRFVEGSRVKKIEIGTEQVVTETGEKIVVSSIEILLSKKEEKKTKAKTKKKNKK